MLQNIVIVGFSSAGMLSFYEAAILANRVTVIEKRERHTRNQRIAVGRELLSKLLALVGFHNVKVEASNYLENPIAYQITDLRHTLAGLPDESHAKFFFEVLIDNQFVVPIRYIEDYIEATIKKKLQEIIESLTSLTIKIDNVFDNKEEAKTFYNILQKYFYSKDYSKLGGTLAHQFMEETRLSLPWQKSDLCLRDNFMKLNKYSHDKFSRWFRSICSNKTILAVFIKYFQELAPQLKQAMTDSLNNLYHIGEIIKVDEPCKTITIKSSNETIAQLAYDRLILADGARRQVTDQTSLGIDKVPLRPHEVKTHAVCVFSSEALLDIDTSNRLAVSFLPIATRLTLANLPNLQERYQWPLQRLPITCIQAIDNANETSTLYITAEVPENSGNNIIESYCKAILAIEYPNIEDLDKKLHLDDLQIFCIPNGALKRCITQDSSIITIGDAFLPACYLTGRGVLDIFSHAALLREYLSSKESHAPDNFLEIKIKDYNNRIKILYNLANRRIHYNLCNRFINAGLSTALHAAYYLYHRPSACYQFVLSKVKALIGNNNEDKESDNISVFHLKK